MNPSLPAPSTFGAFVHSARYVLVSLCLACAAMSAPAVAEDLPDFETITGHAFGERITQHHQMVDYLEALAEASPRVTVVDQGRSWEGRRLLMAVVTSPANHQRLDAIRQGSQRLADPRPGLTGERRGDAPIPSDQPAVIWFGGSIHGFELSGSEGLLRLLERLAQGEDADTLAVLDDTVVLIDPMINPDGRDAFAQFNHRQMGASPNPRRQDWNNAFSTWQALQFRTGHYFFDTNRDWFAQTQKETRARVATLIDWRPQVMVDAHEMGADTEFYFDPPTQPYGSFFPAFAKTWFGHFGEAYAESFDELGFEYTQGEMFNYYYPGYTTSYGSYLGAVGMLYEQGSSRGLALERSDGSVRRLADALQQQYTAAWTAVRVTAAKRQQLLDDYRKAKRQALDDGGATRRYLWSSVQGDAGHGRELADLLRRNGIEVYVLDEEVTFDDLRDRFGRSVDGRSFAAGSWVVEASQPASPLLRTLLEPHLEVPKEFLEQARQRLDRGENPRFYDMTAWSLPLLFNLDAFSSAADGRPKMSLMLDSAESTAKSVPESPAGAAANVPAAEYAYLVDGRSATAMSVLHQLRLQGIRASVLTQDSRLGGQEIARGTVVVRAHQRDEALTPEIIRHSVEELAQRFGVGVHAVDSGRGDEGFPTLGHSESIAPKPVSVAIVAQGGVQAYSFGFSWFSLEEQYGIATTVLNARDIANMPLHDFDTLILPDLVSGQRLAQTLGQPGIDRITGWVRDGGNLVVLGAATDLARQQMGLISLRSWYETPKPEGGKVEGNEGPVRRFSVPGAIVEAKLDPEAWLTVGYQGSELPFLIFSDRLYVRPKGPPEGHRQVAVSVPSENLVTSGHLWPESLERLPDAVLAYSESVGNGRVTAFAEDLSFRGYWRGSDRLLLNAILLGPSI